MSSCLYAYNCPYSCIIVHIYTQIRERNTHCVCEEREGGGIILTTHPNESCMNDPYYLRYCVCVVPISYGKIGDPIPAWESQIDGNE